MAFSGALTLTDLDDFLAPSQACILPVRQSNKVSGQETGNNADTEIHIDANNNYYEVEVAPIAKAAVQLEQGGIDIPNGKPVNGLGKPKDGPPIAQQLQKAEISLNDCLACSGCVTSTESLLITLQSHLEVQTYISTNPTPSDPSHRTGVLSISPQTLASLAASYPTQFSEPIPLPALLRRIRTFLQRPENGGWNVWDTTFARHLSLLEHIKEFDERRARSEAKGKGKADDQDQGAGLPMLASACPGWVCYAEKAHGEMLGFLSAVRSSQGVMGALVKEWWAGQKDLSPQQIYHVTVMPCYDKKLEASRSDFYSSVHQTRDVDCVLTTGELDLLLSERGFDPLLPCPSDGAPHPPSSKTPFPELLTHPGTSSGSYLHTLITALSTRSVNPTNLVVKPVRGSDDHVEYLLEDTVSGDIIFKGIKCYGFRNLQNLVRKIAKETGIGKAQGRTGGAGKLSAAVAARRRAGRIGKAKEEGGGEEEEKARKVEEKKVDYVEVMACPGGCVNGGGQMKPRAAVTEVVEKVVEKDEEGYERVWEAEGVEKAPAAVDEGMRWSTKAWVSKVESIYWSPSGLLTPPISPSLDKPRSAADTADELAKRIILDVSKPTSGDFGEDGRMDDEAEERRWEFLRTRYRKVESDISGLAGVKW